MSSPRSDTETDAHSLAGAPSESQSIATYDRLAVEYDDERHRTTRELERLSARSVAAARLPRALVGPSPLVVELGSGTGALTGELAAQLRGCRLLISDPSARMLAQAMRRLDDSGTRGAAIPIVATAAETISRLGTAPAAIVAGLADPFLSAPLLRAAVKAGCRETAILVTLPGATWARAERRDRLGIPVDRTRFRTSGDEVLYSRSLALDPPELAGLFADCGIKVLGSGSIVSEGPGWDPRPAVSWALGRPLLASTRRAQL